METQQMTLIGFVLIFLVVAALAGIQEKRRTSTRLLALIRSSFGKKPADWMKGRRTLDSIASYSRHREAGHLEQKPADFRVDDITWKDLDMDKVYARLDYCLSAPGEELLYDCLRCPSREDDFDTLEAHIRHYTEQAALREQIQIRMLQIGKSQKYSLYDYLEYLSGLRRSAFPADLISLLALVAGAVGCFIRFQLFFPILLIVLLVNVFTYFRTKGQIEPYLVVFTQILRLLEAAESLSRIKDAVLQEELAPLQAGRDEMKAFRRGAGLLMSRNGGSPTDILMDYVRIITHADLIKFEHMRREVDRHRAAVDAMFTVIGTLDLEVGLVCYRASLQESGYCLPQFAGQGIKLDARDLTHPLQDHAVPNSICTDRHVLLTGCNASGKSTFLKTVALSAILAQSVHTVCAQAYRAPMLRIYTSMALQDHLESGESYYIVEIRSLKRILDAASGEGNPVLAFVDEVLRGTNTIERIAASTQILKSLVGKPILCFAATHDLELTQLLAADYENYHFDGIVTDEDVQFTYQLKTGPATERNAIRLLERAGYEHHVVEEAQRLAEQFEQTGVWA